MMSTRYKFIHLLLLSLMSTILIGCSSIHNAPSRNIAASKISEFELPPGVEELIYDEQILISRDLDESVIMSPKLNNQDEFYTPEKRNVFALKTYWINEEYLNAFKDAGLNPELEKLMHRTQNGVSQWRFIVHPESESFYSELLKTATRGKDWYATSTSSSRTLVVWPPTRPDLVFFGKLSLDKEIAGVARTIPAGEVARSLGTTATLNTISSDLPKNFNYFPESIGLMPKNFERGGMIVREIPEDIKSGKDKFVPLFSLYAKCKSCRKNPLLMDMINRSGMGPEAFVRNKIISPFLDQWLELVINEGISMEPHAQNVLVGIDDNQDLNGKFLHRDFGGFNIDFEFRKKAKLKIPPNLPAIKSLAIDYHQKFHVSSLESSLHTYFISGFAFNLDKVLSQWSEEGLIPKYFKGPTFFQDMVLKELAKKLKVKNWKSLKDTKFFDEVILKLRNQSITPDKSKLNCNQIIQSLILR
jgi:hypothetical protein